MTDGINLPVDTSTFKTIYPATMSIYREEYQTKSDYIKDYRDLNQHYDFKVRIFGGWKFFETAEAMKTWKAQG